jgi:hypothetical protein
MICENTLNQGNYKKHILNKIEDIYIFGTSKEDVDYIIKFCKLLTENYKNQYFFNIISDLEQKFIYSSSDIYALNDLDKIKNFIKYSLII